MRSFLICTLSYGDETKEDLIGSYKRRGQYEIYIQVY